MVQALKGLDSWRLSFYQKLSVGLIHAVRKELKCKALIVEKKMIKSNVITKYCYCDNNIHSHNHYICHITKQDLFLIITRSLFEPLPLLCFLPNMKKK